MRCFAVHYRVRKGLGPGYFLHTELVCFDDIDPETTDRQLKEMVIWEAEAQMTRKEDFRLYGYNWIFYDIEET